MAASRDGSAAHMLANTLPARPVYMPRNETPRCTCSLKSTSKRSSWMCKCQIHLLHWATPIRSMVAAFRESSAVCSRLSQLFLRRAKERNKSLRYNCWTPS